MRNRAVEHNVASSDGGQSCGKGRKLSAKSGSLSIFLRTIGPRKLAVIRCREVAAKRVS